MNYMEKLKILNERILISTCTSTTIFVYSTNWFSRGEGVGTRSNLSTGPSRVRLESRVCRRQTWSCFGILERRRQYDVNGTGEYPIQRSTGKIISGG